MIELMIVVAIIGILAAIAIPQYQTYVSKSQVSRVMYEGSSLKSVVESCILEGRTVVFSNLPNAAVLAPTDCNLQATSSSVQLGAQQGAAAAAPDAGTGYSQVTLTPAANSTIVATFGNGAAASLTTAPNNTLTWTRSNTGTWICTSTVPAKYRAKGCEN